MIPQSASYYAAEATDAWIKISNFLDAQLKGTSNGDRHS
jgi:hypothetical protein